MSANQASDLATFTCTNVIVATQPSDVATTSAVRIPPWKSASSPNTSPGYL